MTQNVHDDVAGLLGCYSALSVPSRSQVHLLADTVLHSETRMTRLEEEPCIEVRQATASDLDVVVSILREAADWLTEKGIPLWPSSDFTSERMQPAVDVGDLIVAEDTQEVVAVVLRQWEDPLFWPDHATGEAAHLHKLAVRRAKAGQGYVEALMNWIAVDTAGRGIKYLRLDCAPRAALLGVYEKLGFVLIDQRKVDHFTVARLQKKVL